MNYLKKTLNYQALKTQDLLNSLSNLGQLHIIRGIAALMVAIGHAKIVFWVGGKEYLEHIPLSEWSPVQYILFALDMASSASEEFVTMFFVLSGFFIAYTYSKNKWKWNHFYTNRMIRIYPPFLFAVILSIVAMFIIAAVNPAMVNHGVEKPIAMSISNAYTRFDFMSIVKILFFQPHRGQWVGSNLSLWSLSAEFFFYILAPLVILRKRWAFYISIPLYLIGWYLDFEHFTDVNTVGEFVFEHCFYFFTGIMVFDFISTKDWKKYVPSKTVSYILLLGITAIMIALGALSLYPYGDLTSVVMTILSIFILLKYPITNNYIKKIGKFLGNISYSLYVSHLPIYFLLYLALTEYTGTYKFFNRVYWVAIPIVVFLSYFIYKLVEEPTLHWIKQFKAKHNYVNLGVEKTKT